MVILLLVLAGGVGLVLSGAGKLQTEVPTCYGRPMAPGDICHARNTGPVTEGMPEPHDTTYQEQLDSLTSGGWTSIGLGLVLVALAVVIGLAWAAGAAADRNP
ncbi:MULTISPECIES: hypothetical protein [unclassified Kitasatospora]|uniref:hypothetical protein n=1 Tax=unclassified Kitasatospora TaxID=2633591 RepID=UPI001ADEC087|nr:hypothetical protein [Kitasatospora sp. RG8]MBP0454188.1 hypothetical protein [Kitasatospora sp. RG8]